MTRWSSGSTTARKIVTYTTFHAYAKEMNNLEVEVRHISRLGDWTLNSGKQKQQQVHRTIPSDSHDTGQLGQEWIGINLSLIHI